MLSFYNTLTRKIEEFKPLRQAQGKLPSEVRIYTCGPTVYDLAHIGHARTYIFADLLRRALKYNGYQVKQVMNITDVGHLVSDADLGEDKIEAAARRMGKTPKEIARFFEKDFWQMMEELNIEKPEIICRATDHIIPMIQIIGMLERKGYTYETLDGIYFDISKFAGYPKLGGFKLEEQKAGARVPVRGEKKNPHDFALWKKATPSHLQQWDSPWGRGFPGWHIECSAMSLKYLGEAFKDGEFHPERSQTIDIHSGGVDHIQIHHNNEIAQSEAATGKPFVKYWIHTQPVFCKGKKMSKSKGNLVMISNLLNRYSPNVIRWLILSNHFTKKWEYKENDLKKAQKDVDIVEKVLRSQDQVWESETREILQFIQIMDDNLNTPKALKLLLKLAKEKSSKELEYLYPILGFIAPNR